ncbi:hypothetical protein AAA799E16_01551 [Marine Group I thaumarchaeote SCGC AAA799-E16]|uniref:Uncharacterized protein n=4 Tax=Marine Group I TaxID=905826 RepID=A0A081RL27_9ARCH|nr:hypothetical protein AAA799N04_01695 [Marine Group I thaumarchaeote SCGC AAA799-N04]KER05763.1 hypothetical protein AAA799E16_01551 [Marine Group I thaumarchaeote SCGC AAA799-E16]KFM15626.1 hypothetical protein AAA799D11_01145 [Marine Group I thaumarchaeote SCGC AAA799-D11]KFM15789.1 hypothetical protein SCCGRSA3_02584 [Marine Group I thaumarchaeote SCGC RSA3]
MSPDDQNEKDNYNNKEVLVRFKFKDEKKSHQEWMSYFQYQNLKQVNIIEYCEIVSEKS